MPPSPKSSTPALCFQVEPLATLPACSMEFAPIFSSISIEVDRGQPRTWGPIAGAEGLGCLFELDEDQVLRALELELAPYARVDVAPMAMLAPLRSTLHGAARPGRVRMGTAPTLAINPDAVWLFSPFGSALFSFDQVVIAPEARLLSEVQELEWVAIAEGTTLGLARGTGKLRLVFLEHFSRRQRLGNLQVSAERQGEDFMRVLDALHTLYYEDLEPGAFEQRAEALVTRLTPPAGLLPSEWGRALDALRQLVSQYRDTLVQMI